LKRKINNNILTMVIVLFGIFQQYVSAKDDFMRLFVF